MKHLIYIFLCLNALLLKAQTPSFVAQVSKNKVVIGEVFQLAFTINGQGNNLVYPNLNMFDIYSGPNQSQSMSIVNGNMSQSTTVSFYLLPKKEGKFTIGSASIMSGGQKLETKPIVIEVMKGNPANAQANQNQQQNQQQATPPTSKNIDGDDLFVKTSLNKSKCILGEQLILSQRVYSRVDLRGFQNVKFPPYNGFWTQQETGNQQIDLHQENVNGVMYYVAELSKVYVFPQRTGKLTIEPIEIECVVRRAVNRQPRNIFEQFFGAGGYEDVIVKVKSKPVSVDVIDLPSNNKPLNFTGAVGDFSYKAEVDNHTIKANEAINLKITITGKGNIKLIDPLKLNLPESFEVYDPKISENIKTQGGVSGSVVYNYLMIPREKGEFILNNIEFNYFNPDKKQYISLPSPDIAINVLQGDASSAQVVTSTKNGIKETENDIRYIKTGDLELQSQGSYFFSSFTHYMLLLVPICLFILGLFFVNRYNKANSDVVAVKERKAARIAKKQLVQAEKHMQQNEKELFFNETLNALNKYISDKFAIAIADLSKEKIKEMLLQKQMDELIITRLIDTLNTCEYAKYAPSAVTGDLNKVYNDTVQLISDIENRFKK